MAVTINASTSSGLVQTADTSGIITLQNNGTDALTVSSGNLQFNSGYGSVATAYGCRAWVNFNGTGTVAIRASGNVTSITDNGTGDYTVNFTTALPDTNFASVLTQGNTDGTNPSGTNSIGLRSVTTTTCQIGCRTSAGAQYDSPVVTATIFR